MLGDYIGLALRQARLEAKINQEKLAAMLTAKSKNRVRQNYISKIETNRCGISWERLELICNILRCRPNHVVKLAESLQNKQKH